MLWACAVQKGSRISIFWLLGQTIRPTELKKKRLPAACTLNFILHFYNAPYVSSLKMELIW